MKLSKPFRRCLKRSAACFPNSGMLMAAPGALLRVVDEMMGRITRVQSRGNLSVSGGLGYATAHDQAAAGQVYVEHSQQHVQDVLVDHGSEFMLNLFPCHGHHAPKAMPVSRDPRLRAFQNCHIREHDPLDFLNATRQGVEFRVTPNVSVRPLMVHANGKHARLRASALEGLQRSFWPPVSEIEHPVLLVNSKAHVNAGACHLVKLRELLRSGGSVSHPSTTAP